MKYIQTYTSNLIEMDLFFQLKRSSKELILSKKKIKNNAWIKEKCSPHFKGIQKWYSFKQDLISHTNELYFHIIQPKFQSSNNFLCYGLSYPLFLGSCFGKNTIFQVKHITSFEIICFFFWNKPWRNFDVSKKDILFST